MPHPFVMNAPSPSPIMFQLHVLSTCESLNIDVPAVFVLPHSTHNFTDAGLEELDETEMRGIVLDENIDIRENYVCLQLTLPQS